VFLMLEVIRVAECRFPSKARIARVALSAGNDIPAAWNRVAVE
jgi:hypothetical protein